MTPKKLAEDFNALVKLAKTSEPVGADCVTACTTVYEKAFRYPEVQQVVAWCDEQFGIKTWCGFSKPSLASSRPGLSR